MFGKKFDLSKNEEILKIASPKGSVDGPYTVVYKSISQRWAIVALLWDNAPTLGIRWFWDANGNPQSHGVATWLVIPSMLQNTVLNGLPLDFQFRHSLNRFLAGEISGKELKKAGAK
jgi:hypothetical protein